MKYCYRILIVLSLSFLLATTTYSNPPPNISCVKSAVTKYYETNTVNGKTEFENDVTAITQKAEKYLNQRLAHKNKAKKLAIILDIDDTSVSNYALIKGRDYKDTKDDYDLTYKDLTLPVIKPILSFYNDAIKDGVSVFFVSFRNTHNSKIDIQKNTIATLRNAGYSDWAGIYFPTPNDAKQPSCAFKIKVRENIEKQGYDIVLNIGDQDGDLIGGHADRTYKIPNPLYVIPANCDLVKKC